MPESTPPEGAPESGAEFRQKFEATQAENQALRTVVTSQIVTDHPLVKPEDLNGVDVGSLTTRAAEIQEQRAAEQRELVVSGLKGLGWDDDRIQQELAGQTVVQPKPAVSHTESLGKIGGLPPSREVDTSDMSPRDKIAAGIASRKKK